MSSIKGEPNVGLGVKEVKWGVMKALKRISAPIKY